MIQAPSPDEQRNDVRARGEGLRAAQALDPRHVVEVIQQQKAESERETRWLRESWSYWWDLWQNRISFGDKEEWQTQIWIPKPFTATEQATSLIQRALLETADPFGVGGRDDRSSLIAQHVWSPMVSTFFEQAGFVGKFADACKVGFITGVCGYLKYRWQRVRSPVLSGIEMDPMSGSLLPSFTYKYRGALAIDYVLPWNVFRDPRSKPRENFSGGYLIHSEWVDRPMLWKMMAAGWDRTAVAALLQMKGSAVGDPGLTQQQEREARRKEQELAPSPLRNTFLVDEWWGDMLNEHGDPIFPDALALQSNEKLLLPVTDNPLWATDMASGRRKWPFLAAAPISHPARFEGRGIVEQNADLSRLFSGTFCMMADGMNWTVNPPTELFQDGLADYNDLGHYPGKLWVKRIKEPVLNQSSAGKIDVGAIMAFLQYVSQLTQNSDFVTDFAVGLPGSRSDVTARETTIKTQQSLAVFDGMSRNIELLGRESVELGKDMLVQYVFDWTDPSIAAIVGQENAMFLMGLSIPERFEQLQGNYTYTFTGISQALDKAETLKRVTQFGQLAGAVPYVQVLATQAPWVFSQVLVALRNLLGLADKIDLPEDASALQAPLPAVPLGAGASPPGAPGTNPAIPGSPAELLAMGGGQGAMANNNALGTANRERESVQLA